MYIGNVEGKIEIFSGYTDEGKYYEHIKYVRFALFAYDKYTNIVYPVDQYELHEQESFVMNMN